MDSTKPERVYEAIEYELDGTRHYGTFYVERGWLTLRTDIGHKGAPLNSSPPEALARILFDELVADSTRG
jgi:hypothetical protein